MVNVTKGILVECDPAMKQFLLHLDEKFLLGSKFIIQDLDETHLFISPEVIEMLKSQIDDLMDKISVPLVNIYCIALHCLFFNCELKFRLMERNN